MKYAIYAYEALYDGLYGVYTDFVVDVKSPVEAQEMAEAESLALMENYPSVMDPLYETVYNLHNDEELDEETVRIYVEELMGQNICFKMRRVYDDAPDDIDTDYEEFVEKYGIPYSYDEGIQYILDS